ncbi:unnamed protein product, partial [Candidula unifasciata]
MIMICTASVRNQKVLLQFTHRVYKQIWTCTQFCRLPENLSCTSSQLCLLLRNHVHQKHYQDSGSPNYNKYNAVGLKSYHQKQNDRRWPWIEKMHRQLMKSVVLPPDKQALKQKLDNSHSTGDLMSMVWSIHKIDKESMNFLAVLWQRFDLMTLEEILTVADVFYLQNVHVPSYASAMITFADEQFESLVITPLQLTRLMFHINNHGSAPQSLFHSIEKTMSDNLSDFDVNLVAAICMLLFTCQSRIKSPILVDKIAKKLLENFRSLQEPSYLHMLMKMFRYSNYINVSFYKKLGDILVNSNFLNRCKSQTHIMHIAFAYACVSVTHPQLFHHILMACQKTFDHSRSKDIAKTIWACGNLVTNQKENIACIHDIVLQLRKDISVRTVRDYPESLIELLMGLAMLNIYPYDLFNVAFDPVILKILYGLPPDREKFIQLMFLDNSLSIECPDYSGCRLTEADRAVVAQKVAAKCVDMDIQLRKSVKPAVAALTSVLNADLVECMFVLPHCQTTDILLAYDMSKQQFVKPVTKPLGSKTIGTDHDKSVQQLVLVLMSRTQTSYDGQPLGLLHCKIRQLKALGYLVVT